MSSDVTPFPKSVQLARGERRYRRRIASPKQWAAIAAGKGGPCRVCLTLGPSHLHHVVFREDGGDDLTVNIAPVCADCHAALHNRAPAIVRLFLARLSDAEYAYMVTKGGADYAERAYGITYGRGES